MSEKTLKNTMILKLTAQITWQTHEKLGKKYIR